MKTSINAEIAGLAKFLKTMPRSKRQIHGLNESDCEILKLSPRLFLAMSVDSVSEEWAYRLYRNPETLAWLSVQGTLSDLVACGVRPQGFLFSPLWEMGGTDKKNEQQKKIIFKTVQHSLHQVKVPLLGGDQGEAASLSLTGVAMGVCKKKPLTRIGVRPGDYLCLVGEMGIGPALGFRYLLGLPEADLPEKAFRPLARVEMVDSLLAYAHAAMDTSDGFCSTLHQFTSLNNVTAEIDFTKIRFAPLALKFCKQHSLPPLSLCYGEHGDYQVLFSVPPKNLNLIRRKIKGLQVIGRVRPKHESTHRLWMNKKYFHFNPSLLAHFPKNNLECLTAAFESVLNMIKQMELKNA